MSAILPPHPLDHLGVLKIALSEADSATLAAVGPHYLILATQADATAPEAAQGRMILHCLPCSKEAADGAFRVATGKARAAKLKPLSHPSDP